jgi:hypothetical protein
MVVVSSNLDVRVVFGLAAFFALYPKAWLAIKPKPCPGDFDPAFFPSGHNCLV